MRHKSGGPDDPRTNQLNSPGIRVLHPPDKEKRQAFSARKGMSRPQFVVPGNSDKKDPSPRLSGLKRMLNGITRPGSLEHAICSTAVRPFHEPPDPLLPAGRKRNRPEPARKFQSPSKSLHDVHVSGTCMLRNLKNQKPDWTGSDDKDGRTLPEMCEIDSVDGNAERLQKCGRCTVDLRRHRKTRGGGNNDVFAQAPIVGEKSAEVKTRAEIRIPLDALFASSAGLRGVHGDTGAGPEDAAESVGRPRSDVPHHSGEFVTQDQRLTNRSAACTCMTKSVKIASANSDGLDGKENLPWPFDTRFGNFVDRHPPRTVESGSEHAFRIPFLFCPGTV